MARNDWMTEGMEALADTLRGIAPATGTPVTPAPREVCAFNKVESATEYAKRREREEQRAALLMQVQSNLRDPLTSRAYE